MILLLSLTSVTAQAQEQTALKVKQVAPFSGVLVPKDTYKKMFVDIQAKDSLQAALTECANDYSSYQGSSEMKQVYFFGAGALLGIIAGVVASKK